VKVKVKDCLEASQLKQETGSEPSSCLSSTPAAVARRRRLPLRTIAHEKGNQAIAQKVQLDASININLWTLSISAHEQITLECLQLWISQSLPNPVQHSRPLQAKHTRFRQFGSMQLLILSSPEN
jgi:hypothetical protein